MLREDYEFIIKSQAEDNYKLRIKIAELEMQIKGYQGIESQREIDARCKRLKKARIKKEKASMLPIGNTK